jgi:hypothetical protein
MRPADQRRTARRAGRAATGSTSAGAIEARRPEAEPAATIARSLATPATITFTNYEAISSVLLDPPG